MMEWEWAAAAAGQGEGMNERGWGVGPGARSATGEKKIENAQRMNEKSGWLKVTLGQTPMGLTPSLLPCFRAGIGGTCTFVYFLTLGQAPVGLACCVFSFTLGQTPVGL